MQLMYIYIVNEPLFGGFMEKTVIEDVKKTIPLLEEHGVTITETFYSKLFDKYPAMKNVFNMTHQKTGHQKRALANAVLMYAKNIDRLENLSDAVKIIAHKHVAVGVKKEHYPIVGSLLLESIMEVLSIDENHFAIKAWAKAYGALADIFISVEDDLRAVNKQEDDFKEYRVAKIEDESDSVKSFYFTAEELPSFEAGQYVSIAREINGQNVIRQYTLSDAMNNECLRISVKKDMTMSELLHSDLKEGDTVKLSRPSGDFLLNLENQNDKVFISAGIGITPFVSMMKKCEKEDVSFKHVHCDKDYKAVPFKNLFVDNGSILFLEDNESLESAKKGMFNLEATEKKELQNKDYYICGPVGFMKAAIASLREAGVTDDNINYEFFGSVTESL